MKKLGLQLPSQSVSHNHRSPYGILPGIVYETFRRRPLLQAGALSALNLFIPQHWQLLSSALASHPPANSKPAKACIFLFMWGGPSQLDTFDLKPNAPSEIRGPFNPISTKTPGLQICEHFSKLSQQTDKITLIRSLAHDDPAHLSSGHATVTGQWAPVRKSDDTPPSSIDSPHLGALVSAIKPAPPGLPSFVTLPWKAYHPAAPGGEAPGQHGGWLGPKHDGLLLTGDPNSAEWKPAQLTLPADITLDRLQSRIGLLELLDQQQSNLLRFKPIETIRQHQAKAADLLASPKIREAFDLSLESPATRDQYGRHIHGQSVLMARRLIEKGIPLVSVNWHNDGRNFWDTHGDNFNRLKNDLIPPADQALAALLEDLQQRGMLDETLVVWVGEFGRRPQITNSNAGREHWPYCYSGLLAGGGINGGIVYGESDKHAAYPLSNPVSPLDFATTILHALGIPTDIMLQDREGRPHRVTSGKIIDGILG